MPGHRERGPPPAGPRSPAASRTRSGPCRTSPPRESRVNGSAPSSQITAATIARAKGAARAPGRSNGRPCRFASRPSDPPRAGRSASSSASEQKAAPIRTARPLRPTSPTVAKTNGSSILSITWNGTPDGRRREKARRERLPTSRSTRPRAPRQEDGYRRPALRSTPGRQAVALPEGRLWLVKGPRRRLGREALAPRGPASSVCSLTPHSHRRRMARNQGRIRSRYP